MTYKQAQEVYGIQGRSTVLVWLRKHGTLDWSKPIHQLMPRSKETPSQRIRWNDCYQNALAERINGILKQEFLLIKCNTGKELELLIKQSIQTYNTKRPHLSLSMKTPDFVHEKTCEDYSTGSCFNY